MAIMKIETIIQATAQHFGIPITVLLNKKMRATQVTQARHIAQYLARKMTYYSLKQVGESFKTDHSSIIYGFNRTATRMVKEPQVRVDVDAIKAKLNGV